MKIRNVYENIGTSSYVSGDASSGDLSTALEIVDYLTNMAQSESLSSKDLDEVMSYLDDLYSIIAKHQEGMENQ